MDDKAKQQANSKDRDYERIFVGNRQINVAHFYSIGNQCFAVGYWTHDGVFIQGITRYYPDGFTPVVARLYTQPDICSNIF